MIKVIFATRLMTAGEFRKALAHANEYKQKDEYTHTALMLRMTPPKTQVTYWV